MHTVKSFNDPLKSEFFGTMAFSAGVAIVGWLLVMSGLVYEANNLVSPEIAIYSSLSWFMLIFHLLVIVFHLGVNVFGETLRAFRHTILHLASIAFVFLVFQFERSVLAAHLYRNLTNGKVLPGATTIMTGLALLSLCYLHWIAFLGSLEWFDRDIEDLTSDMADKQTHQGETEESVTLASRQSSLSRLARKLTGSSTKSSRARFDQPEGVPRKLTVSSMSDTHQLREVAEPSPITEIVIEGKSETRK